MIKRIKSAKADFENTLTAEIHAGTGFYPDGQRDKVKLTLNFYFLLITSKRSFCKMFRKVL
jgi:hypothetical protein